MGGIRNNFQLPKAGRSGVGRALYGAKFNHEFSHPKENRPPWDFGPTARRPRGEALSVLRHESGQRVIDFG